jgi:hypothetical protein
MRSTYDVLFLRVAEVLQARILDGLCRGSDSVLREGRHSPLVLPVVRLISSFMS